MNLRFLLPLFCSSLLLFSCGGGGSATDELVAVMTDITAVLEDVKDEATAKSAREKLEPLTGRLTKMQTEASENAGDKAVVMDEDDVVKFTEATTKYSEQLNRVLTNPDLFKHLEDVLVP